MKLAGFTGKAIAVWLLLCRERKTTRVPITAWRDIHLFDCAADGDKIANRAMHALKGRALAESFRDYSS